MEKCTPRSQRTADPIKKRFSCLLFDNEIYYFFNACWFLLIRKSNLPMSKSHDLCTFAAIMFS
ncbi:hypothetical protein CW304_09250 [Bacillus sp. UFRGS-B20]|nr:hypothetical protein CW304_09250 [Bacillus sp. UFRGS-B20]